ncbi:MAG: hypothetical protein IJJ26_04930 [Victivallales bacterium]|nr:hypothetical protein [Victivallales bacterium]
MKHEFLFVFLSLASVCMAVPQLRVDLTLKRGGEFVFLEKGLRFERASWDKGEKPRVFLGHGNLAENGSPTTLSICFKVTEPSPVTISLRGPFQATKENEWCLIHEVERNHYQLPPGGFDTLLTQGLPPNGIPDRYLTVPNPPEPRILLANQPHVVYRVNHKQILLFQLNATPGVLYEYHITASKDVPTLGFFNETKLPPFSPDWTLYPRVATPVIADTPPEAIGNVKPMLLKNRPVKAEGTRLDLVKEAGKMTSMQCSLLYNVFDSPVEEHLLVSFAADWWMRVHLNGQLITDTMQTGNGFDFQLTQHFALLPIRKGRNVLVAEVYAGSGGSAFLFGPPRKAGPPEAHVYKEGPGWRVIDMDKTEILPGSALDQSNIIDAPAGKYGRVIQGPNDALGFEKAPERSVRLKGVSSGLPPPALWKNCDNATAKKNITQFAMDCRRQGYNCFRDNGIDAWLMYGSNKALQPNPEMVDRFDWMFAEFKKQGIYWHNVVFSYHLYQAEQDHGESFDKRELHKVMMGVGRPWERERWKAGAKVLLNHVNPYTGIAWKDDPALAIVEFHNENYLGFARIASVIHKYPIEFQFVQDKWKAFLKVFLLNRPREQWPEELRKNGIEKAPMFQVGVGSPELQALQIAFHNHNLIEMNRWCEKTLRELGYQGVITNNTHQSVNEIGVVWNTLLHLDSHAYFSHPSNWIRPTSTVAQHSAVEAYATIFRTINSRRPYGCSMGVGEFNYCLWNPYQYELPLALVAYATHSNYSTLDIHSEAVLPDVPAGTNRELGIFTCGLNPVLRASEFVGAYLFLRGDVTPSPHRIAITIPNSYLFSKQGTLAASTEQSKVGLLAQTAYAFPELPPRNPFAQTRKPDYALPISGSAGIRTHGWFSEAIDAQDANFSLEKTVAALRQNGVLPPGNQTDPQKGILQTDTGEILLNAPRKLLQLDTPRTQAVSMPAGQGPALSQFAVNHASINVMAALTAIDSQPIASSQRMVLTLSTRTIGKDFQVCKDNESRLIQANFRPILYNTGKFDLTVKTAHPAQFTLYALDINGNRRCPLPFQVQDDALRIHLDTDTLPGGPAVFFELARETP